MAITNQERVGKAMDLLRAGLALFVEREVQSAPGLVGIGHGQPARALLVAHSAGQRSGRCAAGVLVAERLPAQPPR